MKLLIAFLITFSFCALALGQSADTGNWASFETGNREVSFSMPPGYLVDTKKSFQGHRLGIFAYAEGVRMDFRVFEDKFANEKFQDLPLVAGSNGKAFEIGNMHGFRHVVKKDGKFTEVIYLFAKTRIYTFTVVFDDKQETLANRFLFSIWVEDKQLFQQAGQNKKPENRTDLKSLSSSPEVVQAYDRKQAAEINVTYEPISGYKEPILKLAAGDRPPVVLDKPMNPSKLIKKFPTSFISTSRSDSNDPSDKFLVKFLANGEIADITVYSKQKNDFVDICVEMIKKAKFLPAFVGGKNINASWSEECFGGVSIFPIYEL